MQIYTLLYLAVILTLAQALGEIKSVNVLFRHGDRTPGNFIRTYVNKNKNNKFYPFGVGGLTNEGKQRVYDLGRYLRNSYNDFLGEVYLTDEVEAMSSDSPRARMSLQLALAGLYPPCSIQKWDEKIYWQPTLTSYKPFKDDTIFVPQICEIYQEEYTRVQNSEEFKGKVKELEPFMRELANNIGRENPITILDMNHLYQTLASEKAMNLSLAPWEKDMFPGGKLLDGAILQYHLYGYTEKLRRLSGGVLLHKIAHDMKDKQQNKSSGKIHLYSGHELNIIMLLQTLGVYKDHMPEYASAVIIELVDINNEFFVRVLYYHGIPERTEALTIPGCDEYCPLERFINLHSNVMPSEEELRCKRIFRAPK